jgi:hypothetical protein
VPYDSSEAYRRFVLAGPTVIPEFAQALESDDRKDRFMIADVLWKLTVIKKWPEAYGFVVEQLRKRPSPEVAGWLLYSVAHRGIADYPEVAVHAARYVHDETFVIEKGSYPPKLRKWRVCDFAAYVLQFVSRRDFGLTMFHVPDDRWEEGLGKAREWARNELGAM